MGLSPPAFKSHTSSRVHIFQSSGWTPPKGPNSTNQFLKKTFDNWSKFLFMFSRHSILSSILFIIFTITSWFSREGNSISIVDNSENVIWGNVPDLDSANPCKKLTTSLFFKI